MILYVENLKDTTRKLLELINEWEGNGNLLQYSCLENSMDGGAWCRLSMGSQSWARLRDYTFFLCSMQGLRSQIRDRTHGPYIGSAES